MTTILTQIDPDADYLIVYAAPYNVTTKTEATFALLAPKLQESSIFNLQNPSLEERRAVFMFRAQKGNKKTAASLKGIQDQLNACSEYQGDKTP